MHHSIRLHPRLLTALLPLALWAGCGGDSADGPAGGPDGAALVEIQPGPATLVHFGERHQLTAAARNSQFTWFQLPRARPVGDG